MFTGLVEGMGRIEQLSNAASGRRLVIDVAALRDGLAIGDSVAMNGCCLTVVALGECTADFEAGPETLERTNLGRLQVGDFVNLERSLLADGRMGGHIVQGHVDGVGRVRSRRRDGDWEFVWFECGELARQLVPKGSVAVDGVSLTVCEASNDAFSVMLIPHTMASTTLGLRPVGSIVNIETDILGKYVHRMLGNLLAEGAGPLVERIRAAGSHE